MIDQEVFRQENWESLKQFRSKYDNEYHLSSSIMDQTQITNLKKEIDKLLLNAVRQCIIHDEHEKVFHYMDMLYFSQSLKLVEKLCEQMKVPDLAQKVAKFLSEKETKDIFMNQQQASKPAQTTQTIKQIA